MNKPLFWNSTSAKAALLSLAVVCMTGAVAVAEAADKKPAAVTESRPLPAGKQTTLGLYVTAAEAYAKWKAAPEKVKVIDVRTPEEYAFIGHPEKVWNIPYAFVTYQRKAGKTEYGPRLNPDFVAEVKKLAGPADTLLLMCRSGDRSAKAVDILAKEGFKNVYTITDGFEGDKVTDPDSVFLGKRMKNGWKNTAPWVYTIDPEKIMLGEAPSGR